MDKASGRTSGKSSTALSGDEDDTEAKKSEGCSCLAQAAIMPGYDPPHVTQRLLPVSPWVSLMWWWNSTRSPSAC